MSFEAPRRGIELFRGIRAAERALLDRVAAWCATVRREPARLAAPFRVVVPSASLRAHLTDRITTEIGSVVGLEIVTMQALARAVVDRVAEPRGSTPRVADELVPVVVRQQAARIAALADELGALDDGYGCLVGTVSDLLDAGFEPALLEPCLESLEALALPARLRRRAGGILELAARVVQELERLGLARSAALMVRATGLVERAPESALPCSALIVYGIVDATGLATDWLAALVRHRDASVWIEHPADPADPGREDFGSRFTERLRERLGGIAPIEVASESDGAEAPGVLALCSAPGVQAEVRGVAERIAALVREGVRPESIGVVVRPVEVARPAIRTHFERLAIPFSGVGPTGPRAAVARRFDALLALLAQRERLPAERFLDVAEIGSRAERADLRVALHAQGVARMVDLVRAEAPRQRLRAAAREIQMHMNPHPAGQMELNVPAWHGRRLPGMQHKYRETVLFFPSQGQTCHAYCTYCFRWAQFVGIDELKFADHEAEALRGYLGDHPEVSSVLFTGGDPLVMKTANLRRYIEPLLAPGLEHLTSIRIGTKAPAYWPHRFFGDPDADDLLQLFEDVRRSGRNLALMAHYSHPRELETPAAQLALRRIADAGAVVRCQAPMIRHVNDHPATWAELWRLQVQLGAVPYYLFVERDTGPKRYFEVSLARAWEIYRDAYKRVSGLARTVRGPSMSATPGKVVVDGVTEVAGERVFVLEFIQARDPDWVGRPFFARYDPEATWLDQLEPALGADEFFFEPEMRDLREKRRAPAWGRRATPTRRPIVFGRVEWE